MILSSSTSVTDRLLICANRMLLPSISGISVEALATNASSALFSSHCSLFLLAEVFLPFGDAPEHLNFGQLNLWSLYFLEGLVADYVKMVAILVTNR